MEHILCELVLIAVYELEYPSPTSNFNTAF